MFHTSSSASRPGASELEKDADPASLAMLAAALLHSIAIRARTGTPRAELREIARKAVNVICGDAGHGG
jgi:hypothetical protein